MSFRVSRTIQTTITIIVDHEDDAVAIAMEPLADFVRQADVNNGAWLRDYKWRERGSPSITPTAPKEPS